MYCYISNHLFLKNFGIRKNDNIKDVLSKNRYLKKRSTRAFVPKNSTPKKLRIT
jgi:hypothetical protein